MWPIVLMQTKEEEAEMFEWRSGKIEKSRESSSNDDIFLCVYIYGINVP